MTQRGTLSRALALITAIGASGCGESKRSPQHDSAGSVAPVTAGDAAPAFATPNLPGTIWFVDDGRLVRIAAAARTAISDPDGGLFPSPWRLPDGRLVAIASRGDGGADSEQLALVGGDGSVQRIWKAAAQVRDPAIDPSGRWIVVAANLDGHSDLYRIELATQQAKRLTNDAAGNFRPTIVGDAIVFVSSRDGDAELYRMPLAGGKPQRLTAFHRDDWEPTPSPDGATLAFLSDREGRPRIFVMKPDGTNQRRLTTRSDADADEASPVWSPDGRSIAYVVQRAGESSVWVRDLATGAERVMTPSRMRDAEPSFSPDGAWLLVSRGSPHPLDLWAQPVAGGDATRITSGAHAEMPRWR